MAQRTPPQAKPAREKPIEVISPPNMLKVKVGGALPKLDKDAIARAEAALGELADQFDGWMADEIAKLETAWSELQGSGAGSSEELYRRAHDIKGLAATYQYPLVTRIAAALCRLIETEERRAAAPAALVAGLVNAIRAAVRENIRTDEQLAGRAIAEDCDAAVAKFLAALEQKSAA